MESQDWATGPSRAAGRGPRAARAVVGRGPRAAGPSDRRAAGPWRAVGHGSLGRGPAFSKTQHANVLVHFLTLYSIECRFNLYTEVDVEYQADLT